MLNNVSENAQESKKRNGRRKYVICDRSGKIEPKNNNDIFCASAPCLKKHVFQKEQKCQSIHDGRDLAASAAQMIDQHEENDTEGDAF